MKKILQVEREPWKYYKLFCINGICMNHILPDNSDFKSTLTYMFIAHVTGNVLPNSSKWRVIKNFLLEKMNIWFAETKRFIFYRAYYKMIYIVKSHSMIRIGTRAIYQIIHLHVPSFSQHGIYIPVYFIT